MSSDQICGVYILSNDGNRVLYTGMSTQLPERIQSHKEKLVNGFAKEYNCTRLVYYEIVPDRNSALVKEKQIKGWTRNKKAAIITLRNPQWADLFAELVERAAGNL
jgi:putative endonuclease